MASVMEIMQLCRLCLVKDEVNIPIFEEKGDLREIFLKISACLPVKVAREDNLPKNICDGCSYKLELLYEFWNTSANSEKQLLKWLSQVGVKKAPTSDKVASVKMQQHSINSDNVVLKQEVVDLGDSHGTDDELDADDLNVSNDAHDYILQQQQLPYQPVTFEFQQEGFTEGEATSSTAGPSATITSEAAEAVPKRKRRAAAMKALPPHIDSEEEDDVDMVETKIAKTEEQSDDSASEDPEPTTFVGLPSTSTDNEQPGPSGVGKGTAEAPCTTNSLRTLNSKKLKKFRRTIHQKSTQLPTCNVCNKSFKNLASLSQHKSVHNEKTFSCEKCDKKFKRNYEVKIHFETYHSKERCFKCEICGKEFYKKQLLKYHYARHTQDYKVKCDQCEKGFYTMLDFKRHYAVRHRGVRFVCNHCNKSFLDENCFKRHIKTHDSDYIKREYKCAECGKMYSTRSGLNMHMKKMHKNVSYVCDICGKSVTSKTSLNHHIMLHTGEKPFVCETCGKCFNKKMLLRIHERIHTKVKPYSCTQCEKSFSQRSTLTVHMRYHTGYRPYHCNICQKDFVTKTLLKVHAKTHGTALVDL